MVVSATSDEQQIESLEANAPKTKAPSEHYNNRKESPWAKEFCRSSSWQRARWKPKRARQSCCGERQSINLGRKRAEHLYLPSNPTTPFLAGCCCKALLIWVSIHPSIYLSIYPFMHLSIYTEPCLHAEGFGLRGYKVVELEPCRGPSTEITRTLCFYLGPWQEYRNMWFRPSTPCDYANTRILTAGLQDAYSIKHKPAGWSMAVLQAQTSKPA